MLSSLYRGKHIFFFLEETAVILVETALINWEKRCCSWVNSFYPVVNSFYPGVISCYLRGNGGCQCVNCCYPWVNGFYTWVNSCCTWVNGGYILGNSDKIIIEKFRTLYRTYPTLMTHLVFKNLTVMNEIPVKILQVVFFKY